MPVQMLRCLRYCGSFRSDSVKNMSICESEGIVVGYKVR